MRYRKKALVPTKNLEFLYSQLSETNWCLDMARGNIRYLMDKRGETKADVSRYYKGIEVHFCYDYLCRFMRGQYKTCNLLFLQLIAHYYGVSLIELISVDLSIYRRGGIMVGDVSQF